MKQLELELKERLLIVELPEHYVLKQEIDIFYFKDILSGNKFSIPPNQILLGYGSELTDEVAEDLVDCFDLSYYVDYDGHNPRSYKLTALESFISSIEAQNYYWGENPVKIIERGEASEHERVQNQNEWQEAESRTFNPEKTLIFKIV